MDTHRSNSTPDAVITARQYPSNFRMGDSNFYSLSLAGDGMVYYTLCSHNVDTHARVYRLDPETEEVRLLGDLGEIVGEAGMKTIPQGKSHSPYYEHEGKLYFASHYGYYKPSSNKEEPGEAPEGYKPYPGGHFIAYDLGTGAFEELVKAPTGEGIITMSMDPARGRLYGLTWPRGHFIYYDLETRKLADLGLVSGEGELGDGETYFCLCRAFGVDPRDGSVYFTNADGEIKRYVYREDRIESMAEVSLRLEIFGAWDPHEPGHQGYNWRQILWHDEDKVFYGVHGRSGYLFAFDPQAQKVELLERICAEELRRNGRFEPFRYGYLSFELGPDGETIYYLTGTHGLDAEDGRRVPETLHLVTYNLRTGAYADHGVLRLEDGRYPTMTQSLAVHPNGRIYTAPWIEKPERSSEGKPGHEIDLIGFENPIGSV